MKRSSNHVLHEIETDDNNGLYCGENCTYLKEDKCILFAKELATREESTKPSPTPGPSVFVCAFRCKECLSNFQE
jgi:hypothetical protein